MLSYFTQKKSKVISFLKSYFKKNNRYYVSINRFGKEISQKLLPFVLQGKMLRAGLCFLGFELYQKDKADFLIPLAAAFELIQSGLLIHDDLMDRDSLRRGKPAVHIYFKNKLEGLKLSEPEHTGNAMAICLGDIAFFLAFDLLAETQFERMLLAEILKFVVQELNAVGIAQMQDVYLSSINCLKINIKQKDILKLYLYKTARYSFSLPLITGAKIAGVKSNELKLLEEISERLGLIFQIKDDELGLFGEEKILGKPTGSDLREGKKTIFLLRLLEEKNGELQKRLVEILNGRFNKTTLAYIQDYLNKSGIRQEIIRLVDKLSGECKKRIEKLNCIDEKKRSILEELVEYNLKRLS